MAFDFSQFIKDHSISVYNVTPSAVLEDFSQDRESLEHCVKSSMIHKMHSEIVDKYLDQYVSTFNRDMHSRVEVLVMSREEFVEAMSAAISKGAENPLGHVPISYT